MIVIICSAALTFDLWSLAQSSNSVLFFGNLIPASIFARAAAEEDLVAATLPPFFPPLPPGYSSFDSCFTS